MHGLIHGRRRRNTPRLFQGRSSRTYDFVSRRIARTMYRRFASDAASVAPANGAVLDVGTGPGVLLVELATRRPDLRLDGIDLSADMVTAATRNLAPFGERAQVRVGDATGLPYEDDSFDLIVSSLSLHHWDHPDQAAPELARVLRPGGQIIFYDFAFAPFDEFTRAAHDRSVLNGRTPQRTPIRTGVPFLRCVRYALSA
jgi:ubiquinone/menaquinone biosynthesis C-methylase UbiE